MIAPMNRILQQWIANIPNDAIDTIGINETNCVNGSPAMLSLAQLTPMASMTPDGTDESPFAPMDRQCFHWRH